MSTLIYKHPTTVSGVSVDPSASSIATSCFDGNVRVFASSAPGNPLLVERRGTQLNAVAMRSGKVATDDDKSTMKEGVAITTAGVEVHPADFMQPGATILNISKSGRYGVATNQMCYDRASGQSWQVVPVGTATDRWPMGVEELPDGKVVTVDLSGNISIWSAHQLAARLNVTTEGLNSVDVSDDGGSLVVTDFGRPQTSGPTRFGIYVYSSTLQRIYQADEAALIHQARWTHDGIVYGTSDGRLMKWDGRSPILSLVSSTPVSKPGKRK